MAPNPKLYPRATIKKIVKAHSGKKLSKNADILLFLDYALFLQALVKEANIHAKQSGAKAIDAKDVMKVTEKTLNKFKG